MDHKLNPIVKDIEEIKYHLNVPKKDVKQINYYRYSKRVKKFKIIYKDI